MNNHHVPDWLWRATVGALALVIAGGVSAALWLGSRPVTSGQPLAVSDWGWTPGPGATLTTVNGRLVLRADAITGTAYAVGAATLPGAIQVRAARSDGPEDMGYGLVAGWRGPDEFTALLIGGDGYIAVGQMRAGAWRWRVPWQQWPHVRRGQADNLLRAECGAGCGAGCGAERCRFWVNGEFAFEVDSVDVSGQVGPALWLPVSNPTSAAFWDWQMWK